MKKLYILIIALALTVSPALAELYQGKTVATNRTLVCSTAEGRIESLDIEVGQTISYGTLVATIEETKVFATQSGTVAETEGRVGESVSGSVVRLNPVSPYTIYCCVDDAYEVPKNTLIHSGETVYIKCTSNGTHRATGRVTTISDDTYQVETTAGELYIGETVYIYRDADLEKVDRIGIGTVVSSDVEDYNGEGLLTRLCVSSGDYVEKGQLLFTTINGSSSEIKTTSSGIVSEVQVSVGDRVTEEQSIASVVHYEDIRIEFSLSESECDRLKTGQRVNLYYPCNEDEVAVGGTINYISFLPVDGMYTVSVLPDDPPQYLDMDVTIQTGVSE